jgi:hypothetical protein
MKLSTAKPQPNLTTEAQRGRKIFKNLCGEVLSIHAHDVNLIE